MGCDFSWYGFVPDHAVQERAVAFIQSGYREPQFLVKPRPDLRFMTMAGNVLPLRTLDEYPFDYFGVAPSLDRGYHPDWHYPERNHFVFDRSDRGRLVTIERDWENDGDAPWLHAPEHASPRTIRLLDGGRTREIGGGIAGQAVLLVVFSLRYCPLLRVSDDYGVYTDLRARLRERGLLDALREETLDVGACCNLIAQAMPSPPAPAPALEQTPAPQKLYDAKMSLEPIMAELMKAGGRGHEWLVENRIQTLGDLMRFSEEELLKTKFFGRRSLKMIKLWLDGMGLTLRKK